MSETEVATEAQVDITDDLDVFTSDFFGEKPEQKQEEDATSTETEQEQEVAEGTDTEAQTTELTDEDEAEAEVELAKPKSKVQERIDELVKQKHDAERNAEAQIKALRAEFEAKLAALNPSTKQTQTETAEPNPLDLNADGTEKYPLGEFDPTYIRDLTRFTINSERVQAERAAREEQAIREQESQKVALHESWVEKVEPAKTRYPDFVEKGEALLSSFDHLNTDYAEYLGTVLMSMDYGPDVLYYLSNNPDEATKIVNSGAQKATIALGRIEAKFLEADQTKLLAKPKVSKAPPPPAATARGTGGGVKTVEPDTDDLDAFTDVFFKSKGRR